MAVITAAAQSELSRDGLAQAIIRLVSDYSIETTPHKKADIDQFADFLEPGASVYVASPPGITLDDVIDTAEKIVDAGFRAVPHILARRIEARTQLDEALDRLSAAGVAQALVVAGDDAIAKPYFNSSLEALQTGLFERYQFNKVGVAGHPEGNKSIGPHQTRQALLEKNEYAANTPLDIYLVTQFGFDADAIIGWLEQIRRDGIELPVHIGMAGRTQFRQLVAYGMRCGIDASLRMLVRRAGDFARTLAFSTPDELITSLAKRYALTGRSRVEKTHYFAFGGVQQTAVWLNAVRNGTFRLNEDANGFGVHL